MVVGSGSSDLRDRGEFAAPSDLTETGQPNGPHANAQIRRVDDVAFPSGVVGGRMKTSFVKIKFYASFSFAIFLGIRNKMIVLARTMELLYTFLFLCLNLPQLKRPESGQKESATL